MCYHEGSSKCCSNGRLGGRVTGVTAAPSCSLFICVMGTGEHGCLCALAWSRPHSSSTPPVAVLAGACYRGSHRERVAEDYIVVLGKRWGKERTGGMRDEHCIMGVPEGERAWQRRERETKVMSRGMWALHLMNQTPLYLSLLLYAPPTFIPVHFVEF